MCGEGGRAREPWGEDRATSSPQAAQQQTVAAVAAHRGAGLDQRLHGEYSCDGHIYVGNMFQIFCKYDANMWKICVKYV